MFGYIPTIFLNRYRDKTDIKEISKIYHIPSGDSKSSKDQNQNQQKSKNRHHFKLEPISDEHIDNPPPRGTYRDLSV